MHKHSLIFQVEIHLIHTLIREIIFILVTTTKLFGAYAEQFIILAPFLEGMTGGHSTFNGGHLVIRLPS